MKIYAQTVKSVARDALYGAFSRRGLDPIKTSMPAVLVAGPAVSSQWGPKPSAVLTARTTHRGMARLSGLEWPGRIPGWYTRQKSPIPVVLTGLDVTYICWCDHYATSTDGVSQGFPTGGVKTRLREAKQKIRNLVPATFVVDLNLYQLWWGCQR